MSEGTVYLSVDILERFMQDVFLRLGVPEADAAVCAEVLITSDLRGIESHGVGRLKMYYDRIKQGILSPVTRIEVVRETPITAVFDGHNGMGHVIGYRAMETAIGKAKEHGLGAVAVRNSSHFGIDGYYALMAVKEGQIGLSFTNARPSVAPTFGVAPMLGTNPIAFGAPTDEEFPFLYDAATSITQRGKIEVLARAEKETPAGWVIDRDGNLVTDTGAILAGIPKGLFALLPLGGIGETFGGHKGYDLAVMVEILSAALAGAAFLDGVSGFDEDGNPRPHRLGHFFMAIDIEHFIPLSEFKRTVGEILRRLRGSEKAPGQARIYTAGEKEWEREKQVRAEGVPIDPNLQKDLAVLREDLGLAEYDLPF